jgi:hypothetical protein
MLTFYVFEIGALDHAPRSFPVTCPNLDTARAMYDSLTAQGWIMASARP